MSAIPRLSRSGVPSCRVMAVISSLPLPFLMPLMRFKFLYCSRMCSIFASRSARLIARTSLRISLLSFARVVVSLLEVFLRRSMSCVIMSCEVLSLVSCMSLLLFLCVTSAFAL